jgi:hypothetical protein
MADLSDLQAAQTVKLVGANGSGDEQSFINATANGLMVDGSAVTQPVSIASLPLPTDAATETTLTLLNEKIPSALVQDGNNLNALVVQEGNVFPVGNTNVNTLNEDAIGSFDVRHYTHITIQVRGTWVGTMTPQFSADENTWVDGRLIQVSSSGNTPAATITGNGVYIIPLELNYIRLRMTAFTSGSAFVGGFARSGDWQTLNVQEVSVTNSVAVTGPLTDAQLRASAVPVSATQSGTWNITNVSGTVSLPTGAATETTLAKNIGISSGGVYGALTMTTGGTTYEAKVGASKLSGRILLTVTPTTSDIYWGYDSSVTTSTGTIIYKNQTFAFDLNPSSTAAIWLVSSSSSVNVRITEAP